MTPRIATGGREEVGIFTWLLARAAGLAGGHEPLRLFLVLGRHRPLFRAWLRFAGRLMLRGSLPRRDAELIILRVAGLRYCDYELSHHRRLGRRAGLGAEDLRRIEEGPTASGLGDRDRAILEAVEQLHCDWDIADPEWDELRRHLAEREAIELCMLVGHYEMLATTIAALRITPEEPRKPIIKRLLER